VDYKILGGSGLHVPALSFGTATFGGGNEFFKAWGSTQVDEARQLVNLCLDAGMNLFDTANSYSNGMSEEILAQALKEISRNDYILSTKGTFRMGAGLNDFGSGRYHLTRALEDSLRRLNTDHIDIYHMHGFDASTPVEETLSTLDNFVKQGKVRYIACSNFSGWHLMKSLSVSERYGWSRYVAHQAYYSLINREFEWELMPLGIDQKVGTIVWSPLASGRLSGKINRNHPMPASDSRYSQGGGQGPDVSQEFLFKIVDVLEELAAETGKSIPQISLNWLLQKPTISSIVVGARNEKQLRENLGAVGWSLTPEQVSRLDQVSEVTPVYPYWHQRNFPH
jgi:aryl-alcohol dehydrogenase-like predicted oxidoreductase